MEVWRIHLEEEFWHKLNTTLVESKCMSDVTSMGCSRRTREIIISSPKTNGGYSVPDQLNNEDQDAKEINVPHPNEMYSRVLPRERSSEFSRHVICIWLAEQDGLEVVVCTITCVNRIGGDQGSVVLTFQFVSQWGF